MPDREKLIRVDAPPRPYTVHVAAGLIDNIGPHLREHSKSRLACVSTDQSVGPRLLPRLQKSLESAGFEVRASMIAPGELSKSLAALDPIYDLFLAPPTDRTTPILALGGGVVGDVTGFIAATCRRGQPFFQIPTTLLAMVDASIGGKTGVNHARGKNLIGAFHQPTAVYMDTATLTTLPMRDLRGGLAECIKNEIIADADGFTRLEATIGKALERDPEYLADLVAHNVAIKARIIEADPYETGARAHLNYGHTFGHAVENASHFAYSHGEAVALGMVAAAHLARDLGMIDEATRERIVALITVAGLPTSGLKLSTSEILNAMATDKKAIGGKLRFILTERIGKVTLRGDIPPELIAKAVDTLH
jgi:3-dehydroquinate synthase